MIKIFKKTFAFFIAVIMMISSFPYMALAENTASATEGSTTAEMTNEELESYIDAKIQNFSIILPEQQLVPTADQNIMSGIVTSASLGTIETTPLKYKNNTKSVSFGTNSLLRAVAVYTGTDDNIRFPIIVKKFGISKDNTSMYINYVSLPDENGNFSIGNNFWDRCIGEKDLTYDPDPQLFSSKLNGKRKDATKSFSMKEAKLWRNYITYNIKNEDNNNESTVSYYEKLPTKFAIGWKYGNEELYGTLEIDHSSFLINMKPYKDIVDSLEKDYNAVKSNKSKYTQKALNNYYKAVRDVIDFDIRVYLNEITKDLRKPEVEAKVINAANAVKNVVENYKESFLDFTAYNSAKGQCDTIIKNQNENAEYESNSFAEFEKVYKDVIAKVENVETQEALDNLTAQLITAQTMLRKNKFSITVNVYKNSALIDTKHYLDELYGYKFNIDLAHYVNETKECVKRWVIYTDKNKTRTVVGTTDSIFTLYITKEAVVDVYIVPLEENAKPEEYSKVVFYGFNGRVIDVQYLKKGVTLTSDKYTTAPNVPFYDFDSWDNASVTGNGKEIVVKAKYTAKQIETDGCTVHYDGFAGGKKTYSYDKLVSLVGAKNDEYFALATTADGINADGSSSILTYLNRNEFHAPKRSEIYVVPVNKEDRVAKVAITGNYATKVNDNGEIASSDADYTKNRAVFNCKFYLPEDCKLIEWGAQISANGKTKTVKGEKLSKHNEYSIYMNVSKNSTSVKAFTAVAYVRYKDSENNIKTIYSQSVEQAFD